MPKIQYMTPHFAVSDALTPDEFPALAALGFKAVVSNLPDGEYAGQLAGKQEAALAWRAGLRFRHVPTTKHDVLTDDVIEGMAEALSSLQGPILAHCRSGTRSAIVWAAASARSQPVDCVLETLAKAGMDFDFLRDDLEAQADRRRWVGTHQALDCDCEKPAAAA